MPSWTLCGLFRCIFTLKSIQSRRWVQAHFHYSFTFYQWHNFKALHCSDPVKWLIRYIKFLWLQEYSWDFLVAQWLRIHLPMQGTRVRAPVWEDPTCRRATKARAPQLLSLCSRAREPQLLSPWATTTEAHVPKAHAPQQEKPLKWEAHAPQRRVAPARRN